MFRRLVYFRKLGRLRIAVATVQSTRQRLQHTLHRWFQVVRLRYHLQRSSNTEIRRCFYRLKRAAQAKRAVHQLHQRVCSKVDVTVLHTNLSGWADVIEQLLTNTWASFTERLNMRKVSCVLMLRRSCSLDANLISKAQFSARAASRRYLLVSRVFQKFRCITYNRRILSLASVQVARLFDSFAWVSL